MRGVVVLAVGLVGCGSYTSVFTDTASSRGVFTVVASSDSGSVSYDGAALIEEFNVSGTSYASGRNRDAAERNEQLNSVDVRIENGTLLASGISGPGGNVDFDIVGPGRIDTDLRAPRGTVRVDRVDGFHVLTGRRIIGREIVGDADIQATDDVDVQILPYTDVGSIRVATTGGDVSLGLPFGLDYQLNVTGNPDFEVIVEDLGFDGILSEGPVLRAWRGFETIRVDVDVRGGLLDVYAI